MGSVPKHHLVSVPGALLRHCLVHRSSYCSVHRPLQADSRLKMDKSKGKKFNLIFFFTLTSAIGASHQIQGGRGPLNTHFTGTSAARPSNFPEKKRKIAGQTERKGKEKGPLVKQGLLTPIPSSIRGSAKKKQGAEKPRNQPEIKKKPKWAEKSENFGGFMYKIKKYFIC